MTTASEKHADNSPCPRFQFSLRTLLLFLMLGSSMTVFGTPGIAVFFIVVGVAAYLHKFWSVLALEFLGLAAFCGICVLYAIAVDEANKAGNRATCLNKLHQLGLGLQNYREANGQFPPACTVDKNGNPLQSWRVLILPFMEYDSLYKSLDLAISWNAPENRALLAIHLKEFACPSDPSSQVSGSLQTNYFAVVGPNTAWDRSKPVAASGDVAATTIMLAEVVGSGVDWAEPKDVSLETLGSAGHNPSALLPSSNHGRYEDYFVVRDPRKLLIVAMADGSVKVIQLDGLSPAQLRRVFEIGGCTKDALAAATDVPEAYRPKWFNITSLALWLVSVAAILVGAVRSRKKLVCGRNWK